MIIFKDYLYDNYLIHSALGTLSKQATRELYKYYFRAVLFISIASTLYKLDVKLLSAVLLLLSLLLDFI